MKFADDDVALNVIEKNFVVTKGGIIRPKKPEYVATEREIRAINYLLQEWDYAFQQSLPFDGKGEES